MPAKSARANAPALSTPRPLSEAEAAKKKLIDFDPNAISGEYGMLCTGACLEPVILNGSVIVFDPAKKPHAGDFVVIYKKRDRVPEGGFQAAVKRLVMDIPPWVDSFPTKPHLNSTATPCLALAMLNPPQTLMASCEELLAVHRCIAVKEPGSTVYRPIEELVAERLPGVAEPLTCAEALS